MFGRFGELLSQKLEKVAHFVKEHGKSSIWRKLASFRGDYHVSPFWSTFEQKVVKGGSLGAKARKIVDLAKTCIFSSRLSCFGVLVNF